MRSLSTEPLSFPRSSRSVFRVLVIDDDPLNIQLIKEVLDGQNLQVSGATDAETGLALLASLKPHLVLLDLVLPGVSGMELLERAVSHPPWPDVMMMTAHYSTDSAVEAIQKGASDYLTKPLPPWRLRERIEKWLKEQEEKACATAIDAALRETFQLEGIIGHSPLMHEIFSKVRRIAPHFQVALVSGETGTGKEMLARALHRLSPAANGPLVVCNCAAVTESLFESEFFGYAKGAFTGASENKVGLVEAAENGTLFLDEVGELPLQSQAKLLRLLQSGEVRRIGSNSSRQVKARFVAATNRDLRAMVREKTFREDLFYRLGMVEFRLPRLIDRRDDVPLLIAQFLEQNALRFSVPPFRLTARAQARLMTYSWPGNVRELQNVLDYACMLAGQRAIDLEHLPDWLRTPEVPDLQPSLLSLEEVIRQHALQVLAEVKGNRVEAARILGIGRATLYRMLSKEAAHSSGAGNADPPMSQRET